MTMMTTTTIFIIPGILKNDQGYHSDIYGFYEYVNSIEIWLQ